MRRAWALPLLALLAACAREALPCDVCGTVVVAAAGEPTTLFPPLIFETVGRDISDQVYERLADLAPNAAPIDPAGYRPGLAARVGARGQLELAIPPAARRALAGWRAGHRRRCRLLVRGVCRPGARC